MKVPGRRKIDRVLRRLRKSVESKALILMYHRVAEVNLDPWSLCVTPQHFAEQLEVLQRCAHPMSLQDLAAAHQQGKIPDLAVAVTFDDGYADNLHHAKPLLERYNIPATVFVTAGAVGQTREFWWDELAYLLLQPGQLPETLSLKVNGSLHQWELGAAANYSEEESRRSCQPWKSQPDSRLFFYYSVWRLLQPLADGEQRQALDEIASWANAEPIAAKVNRSLLPEEVRLLADGDWLEVGAHTMTHPFLPAHSIGFQYEEIRQSKAHLEALIDRPVTSFAYPFGGLSPETVRLTRTMGFNCACSTVPETVWRNSDRFQLPRVGAENWNGEAFEKQLWRWFQT
jgi:peptidoglycan/xylan/chitin deacetylase (PgdA/CDA1 family)